MSDIHPTAIISREAQIAPDVKIGPYAIIDGPVKIGPGCVIHAHVRIIGPLTMGARNMVHSGAVLGDWPQDRKFKGDYSETIIGDDNIFREHFTVHRGNGLNAKTIIGSRGFFLVGSHVGHNAVVGNDVIMINGAALGGHTQMADRAILGAGCAIHQFCRMGRLSMISNIAAFNVDMPPFFIAMSINAVAQLNAVGLRRSGMKPESVNALRKMFQIAFRNNHGRPLAGALADLPAELLAVPEVVEVVEFCKTAKRGVARFVPWSRQKNLMHSDAVQDAE